MAQNKVKKISTEKVKKVASKKVRPLIVVVLGPTATGKSDFGVALAKEIQKKMGLACEIVSADSRQVYKGLDSGSGKITLREMKGIPHHLLDVVSPRRMFTVSDFQKLAYHAIDDIVTRSKLPIIVGGTGFYIQSIVDGLILPDVARDEKLRATLEKISTEKLAARLKKLDSARAKQIDLNNRPRIIRAIEIAEALGKVPKIQSMPRYETIQLGLDMSDDELKARIHKRLQKRMRAMLKEVQDLLASRAVTHKRLQELGLEYRYISLFLQGKLARPQMESELELAIWHFAKRQRTWFKRDKRVMWL